MNFEVIICLDGSSDKSFDIINNFTGFKAKILPFKDQRGLGLAYKRLFLEVVKNSDPKDYIVSLDADNTHNTEQISTMIKEAKNHDLDVVVASRFCSKSVIESFPFYRKIISKSTAKLLQIIYAVKNHNQDLLKDYTSGYRLYKAQILQKLFKKKGLEFITEPEFTYTCELLIKLYHLKAKISEIAISYDYGKKFGQRKLRIMRNLWRLIILLIKLKK